MYQTWLTFTLFLIVVVETNIVVESNVVNPIAAAPGVCSPDWKLVGSYCYKVTKGTGQKVFDFDRICSDNNGTFPTFPTLQDYIDFSDFWVKLPNKPLVLLGYYHKENEAKYTDIVNYYSQAPIPFASQFCTGEPDMDDGDGCVGIGKHGMKCWSDIRCTKMDSVPCGPVCLSVTKTGHKFGTVNSWICQYNVIVEKKAVAYTLNQYIPGMTENLFLTANKSGSILNVYGYKGLAAVPTNEVQRYFLVSTVKMSSNMA